MSKLLIFELFFVTVKTQVIFQAKTKAEIFQLNRPHRELENIAAASAAISGPRKVAALLFRNRRRIRIYDMEVEDDDEDEDDTLDTSGAATGNVSNELNSSLWSWSVGGKLLGKMKI